jgi:hypothetical protein
MVKLRPQSFPQTVGGRCLNGRSGTVSWRRHPAEVSGSGMRCASESAYVYDDALSVYRVNSISGVIAASLSLAMLRKASTSCTS